MGTKESDKGRANPPAGRREPVHPDDVDLETTKPDNASAQRGAAAGKPGDVPDANEGREYQGTGILNRKGRFGSSKRPEELTADQQRDDKSDDRDR